LGVRASPYRHGAFSVHVRLASSRKKRRKGGLEAGQGCGENMGLRRSMRRVIRKTIREEKKGDVAAYDRVGRGPARVKIFSSDSQLPFGAGEQNSKNLSQAHQSKNPTLKKGVLDGRKREKEKRAIGSTIKPSIIRDS